MNKEHVAADLLLLRHGSRKNLKLERVVYDYDLVNHGDRVDRFIQTWGITFSSNPADRCLMSA